MQRQRQQEQHQNGKRIDLYIKIVFHILIFFGSALQNGQAFPSSLDPLKIQRKIGGNKRQTSQDLQPKPRNSVSKISYQLSSFENHYRTYLTALQSATTPPSSKSSSSRHEKKSISFENNKSSHVRFSKANKQLTKREWVKSKFRSAKGLERRGRWNDALDIYERILEVEPTDSHSHLALARLQARREERWRSKAAHIESTQQQQQQQQHRDPTIRSSRSKGGTTCTTETTQAQKAFARGTKACRDSIHLWQAWAIYEEGRGNHSRARELFEKALTLDKHNPYVCHAFGLMEKRLGNKDRAQMLFEQALEKTSTAALVCSLGELLISQKKLEETRKLYKRELSRVKGEKDKTEIYLAYAWLEERHFFDFVCAREMILLALAHSPTSSVAQVALARLEGRQEDKERKTNPNQPNRNTATIRRLANACIELEKKQKEETINVNEQKDGGRLFNAWANLEVKNRRISAARKILEKGMQIFPKDQTLFQAAGKVEERVGNFTGARNLYSESLTLEPSAPTLVAYAMLELRNPEKKPLNYTNIKRYFEEALLLDPRHGPAYNAYGKAELRRGNVEAARSIFERGVRIGCSDVASLYHGYATLELSQGNVDRARELLLQGQKESHRQDVGMDSPHRERASFISHTLGMLELNCNRPMEALKVFEDGISRYGNSSQLLLGAAFCDVKLGKQDAARALLERSVLSDKKHAQAWQAWGALETKAGNFKTAKALFECGLKNAPKFGPLWYAYAIMEGRKGNTEKSRMLFAAGLRKAPRYVPLYQGWALLELREENFKLAKCLITEALTRKKWNGAGWLIAAQIEEKLGNDGLVGLILRRGMECAPNDPEIYRALGEYLVRQGKIDYAREVLEQGMEINPRHAPLYHSLAELEARIFNIDGLASLHKRAEEMFNYNALVPPPAASKAWGAEIRAKKRRSSGENLPKGVAALAQRIVENDNENDDDSTTMTSVLDSFEFDPDSYLDEFLDTNSMENNVLHKLMSMDSVDEIPNTRE